MRMASEKQINFINKLLDQKQLDEIELDTVKIVMENGLTIQQASNGIKMLLNKPNKQIAMKQEIEIGFYSQNDEIFKVKESRAGRKYAMRLTDDGFEYAPGAIGKIQSENKMTLDEAKEYGKMTGNCMCCGRILTNENSIAEGIGPICASKF